MYQMVVKIPLEANLFVDLYLLLFWREEYVVLVDAVHNEPNLSIAELQYLSIPEH